MKAIGLKGFGGRDQLEFQNREIPKIGVQDVLVKVHATALNRADILQRKGLYPPPPGESDILGLEVAGEIVALGSEVAAWQVGDKVMALLAGGGYAQFVKVPVQQLMVIPTNLQYTEAAAIPEAFLTAWQALIFLADLKPGENVLIHAGASGVGSAAIQLTKRQGANATVTASRAKHEFCIGLGADVALDYKDEQDMRLLESLQFNVVIEFIGAPNFALDLKVMAPEARMVLLGMMGGVQLDTLNIAPILFKRLHIMGSTLRARSIDYKSELVQSFTSNALQAFESGELKPIVDKVFDWEAVADAHAYMETNQNKGKIVLSVGH